MLKVINNKKLDNFFENALYVNFFIYSFGLVSSYSALFLTSSIFNLFISMLIKFTFAFLPIKIFYDFLSGKFSIKQICVLSLIGIMIMISYFRCKSAMALLIFLYILAFKNIEYDKFIKIAFYSILIPLVLFIVTSFFIDTSNFSTIRENNNVARYSLGFWFSAYSANHYFTLILIYFLLNKNFKFYDYLLINLFNFILFYFTNTRLVFVLVILACILHILITKYDKQLFNLLYYITMLSFPFGFIFIAFLSYLFGKHIDFIYKLNAILTGRLQHVYNGFFRCHIYLFGSQVEMSIADDNYNHVDPQYFLYLYSYGVIVLVLFFLLFFFITYIAYKKRDKYLLLVILIASMRTCFDPQLMTLHLSPFILLASPYIFKYIDDLPLYKKH